MCQRLFAPCLLLVAGAAVWHARQAGKDTVDVVDEGSGTLAKRTPPCHADSMDDPSSGVSSASDPVTEDIVALYAIYQAEWEHRDSLIWSQTFRIFFAALFITLLPYLENYFSLDLPFPSLFFVLASLILTLYFLVLSLAYAERLAAVGATIQKLQGMLDYRLRRVPVGENLPLVRRGAMRWIVSTRITMWTPIAMSAFLILVDIAVLVGIYGAP